MNEKELREIVEKIRRKTPRSWILMSPNSIGEVLTTCAFARSLIEKYGYPISICVRPEHAAMIEHLYPNRFAAVVQMPQATMRRFSEIGLIPNNFFDIDFPINLSPLQYGGGQHLLEMHNLLYKRNGASGLTATDVWRHMLHLDWNAPMERPCLDFLKDSGSLLAKLDLKPGGYALFQLGNNTSKPMPGAFWAALEQMYNRQNTEVRVNAKGSMLLSSMSFQYAKLLELDIVDALRVAYYSGSFISGNNGLLLTLSFLCHGNPNAPQIHSIASDKYCEYYDRLNSDWHGAFVSYECIPSMAAGTPEMLPQPVSVSEWVLSADQDDHYYEEAASAIFANDRNSRFVVGASAASQNFPAPLAYDHQFQCL